MYLIDYIAYGLHLWYTMQKNKEMCRKPISLHPGLGSSLQCVRMLAIKFEKLESHQGECNGGGGYITHTPDWGLSQNIRIEVLGKFQ